MDHATKILYLTLIIKAICEENEINKDVVIEDFIDLLKQENA
jgi:hypothetical protein